MGRWLQSAAQHQPPLGVVPAHGGVSVLLPSLISQQVILPKCNFLKTKGVEGRDVNRSDQNPGIYSSLQVDDKKGVLLFFINQIQIVPLLSFGFPLQLMT